MFETSKTHYPGHPYYIPCTKHAHGPIRLIPSANVHVATDHAYAAGSEANAWLDDMLRLYCATPEHACTTCVKCFDITRFKYPCIHTIMIIIIIQLIT